MLIKSLPNYIDNRLYFNGKLLHCIYTHDFGLVLKEIFCMQIKVKHVFNAIISCLNFVLVELGNIILLAIMSYKGHRNTHTHKNIHVYPCIS